MMVSTVDDYAALARAVPDVKLALDLGHVLVTGEREPEAAVLEFGDRLATVHLEDMRRGRHEHLAFGDGDMDVGAALGALRSVGFDGPRLRGTQPRQLPRRHDDRPGATAARRLRTGPRRAAVRGCHPGPAAGGAGRVGRRGRAPPGGGPFRAPLRRGTRGAMPLDVVDLRTFYAAPLGRVAQRAISTDRPHLVARHRRPRGGGARLCDPFLEPFRDEAVRVIGLCRPNRASCIGPPAAPRPPRWSKAGNCRCPTAPSTASCWSTCWSRPSTRARCWRKSGAC